jgi:hypothetical protein
VTWLQLFWVAIQVVLLLCLLAFTISASYCLFAYCQMLWHEKFGTHEYELEDDDGFLVFDYSKDDPWKCGKCGREFENRRDYNEPRKHYQYHHRGSVRMEDT